jgi:hypothetical protein
MRSICAISVAAVAAGCPKPTPPPAPPGNIDISSSAATVAADGTAFVTITASRTDGMEVRLFAAQGRFKDTKETDVKKTRFASGTGTADLITCDSRTVAGCSGSVRVGATSDDGASAAVNVEFLQLEICGNGKDDDGNGKTDCADVACLGVKCVDSAGAPGNCTAAGQCACAAGSVEICNDGIDNNCDGKIDCADPACDNKICKLGSGSDALCVASVCKCPNVAEICGNGIDDDCDGKTDCADTDCRPVGNNLGGKCDTLGNTCSVPIAGVSTCTTCSGNGGTAQTAEFSCGDGIDNDCDGLIDCQDPDCATLACTTTGKRCQASTFTCVCPGSQATGETTCDDGLDNDCDGLIDCADSDCLTKTCAPFGKSCAAGGLCSCSGNGGPVEVTEGATVGADTCGDGKDNDCDGFVDCADSNCRPVTLGTAGKSCSNLVATPPTIGKVCDFSGQCICPGGQIAEASCADSLDNDCDGLIDCADPDCLNKSCSLTGMKCSATSASGCTCPAGSVENTNALCSDHLDNNCDGKIDCDDPGCAGFGCNTLLTTYKCTTGTPSICKDQGSNYSLVVTSALVRIPADGVANTTISAALKNLAVAAPNETLTFSVTSGPGSVSPTTAVTANPSGIATTTFTAGTTGGNSVITATSSVAAGSVVGSVIVTQPVVGQVNYVNQTVSLMGVRFSSFQETNEITFEVRDTFGAPYPDGLMVTFTHSPVGGSYLGSSANCTTTIPVSCSATAVISGGAGQVKVTLHSGTVASVVAVQAVATAGGGSANATASNIAIVGAKASGIHVSLDCTPKNIPALTNQNCTNSFYASTITCRAAFADRFNNVLGVATQVRFNSEAGAASPPVLTPAYLGPGQVGLGAVTNTVLVNGYSLPVDVAPNIDEYSLSYNSGCGVKVHNPRDGLVSIIASAIGEEGFIDGSNGCPANGVYDAPGSSTGCLGEYFFDQGEPFVDANDDGVRNNNEVYVDANNNGAWDGPNGTWDANTVVWAETRVIYTSLAQVAPAAVPLYSFSRWFSVGSLPPTLGATPAPNGWMLPVPVPPAAAATRSLGVYFTDENFNLPGVETTYSLTVVSGTPATVTAAFTTAPTVPVDNLGLSFTQQFCHSDKTACGSSCSSAPCILVPKVDNYSYGTYGVAQITAAAAGPAEVRANATFYGVTVPISTFGSVQ